MKTAQMFDHIEGQRREVNLEAFTGLRIGQRCQRTTSNVEECLTVRSSKRAELAADTSRAWARGVVLGLEYVGPNLFGENICTATVLFDNGETSVIRSDILEQERKAGK